MDTGHHSLDINKCGLDRSQEMLRQKLCQNYSPGPGQYLIEYKHYFSTREGGGGGRGLGGPTSVIETVILVSQELSYIIQNRKQTPAQSYLRERERERGNTLQFIVILIQPVRAGAGVVAGQRTWRYHNVAADAHDVVTDVSPNWQNIIGLCLCRPEGWRTVKFMIQFPSNLIIIALQRSLPSLPSLSVKLTLYLSVLVVLNCHQPASLDWLDRKTCLPSPYCWLV